MSTLTVESMGAGITLDTQAVTINLPQQITIESSGGGTAELARASVILAVPSLTPTDDDPVHWMDHTPGTGPDAAEHANFTIHSTDNWSSGWADDNDRTTVLLLLPGDYWPSVRASIGADGFTPIVDLGGTPVVLGCGAAPPSYAAVWSAMNIGDDNVGNAFDPTEPVLWYQPTGTYADYVATKTRESGNLVGLSTVEAVLDWLNTLDLSGAGGGGGRSDLEVGLGIIAESAEQFLSDYATLVAGTFLGGVADIPILTWYPDSGKVDRWVTDGDDGFTGPTDVTTSDYSGRPVSAGIMLSLSDFETEIRWERKVGTDDSGSTYTAGPPSTGQTFEVPLATVTWGRALEAQFIAPLADNVTIYDEENDQVLLNVLVYEGHNIRPNSPWFNSTDESDERNGMWEVDVVEVGAVCRRPVLINGIVPFPPLVDTVFKIANSPRTRTFAVVRHDPAFPAERADAQFIRAAGFPNDVTSDDGTLALIKSVLANGAGGLDLSVNVAALDGVVKEGDGAGGILSGTYPDPGINSSSLQELIAGYIAAGFGISVDVVDDSLVISANLAAEDIGAVPEAREVAGITLAADISPSALRSALALVIGTNVQAWDADLDALAGTATQSYGRGVNAVANAAGLRSYAGTVIGQDVQAWDADLDAIAALATLAYGRGFLTLADHAALMTKLALVAADIPNIAESQVTNLVTDLAAKVPATRTLAGLDLSADRTAGALRTALSLVVGTDVQAYNAILASLVSNGTPGATGLALLLAANAASARTTLGQSWVTISDTTVSNAGSGVASVSVSCSGYSALKVMIKGRSLYASASFDTLNLRFNSDSGSNYSTAGGALTTSIAASNSISASQTNTNRMMTTWYDIAIGSSVDTDVNFRSAGKGSTATTSSGSTSAAIWNGSVSAALISLQLFATNGNLADGTRVLVEGLV